MSSSKDSGLSGGSQYLHPTAACGLLGNHALRFETDFVVLNELIGAPKEASIWLCGTEIRRERRFLIGDPACDRIIFKPQTFETVYEEGNLKIKYLLEVHRKALSLSENDTLVLVLVGHGEEGGIFEIGDDTLKMSDLEESVRGTRAAVWLLSTARYSGAWESPLWTLLTAAEADEESVSIVVAGSSQVSGGFFTNAPLAEHVNEFDLNAPCPGSVDEHEIRARQHAHDFGPDNSRLLSVSHPNRSLNWIHQWRDQIGRTYTSTDFTFSPCDESLVPLIPFRSLESCSSILQNFRCAPPSPPTDDSSATSSLGSSSNQSLTTATHPMLSEEEERELLKLARDFLQSKPCQTSWETEIIVRCSRLVWDQTSISKAIQCSLFSELKERKRLQNLALAVAYNLGWTDTVKELGEPNSIKQGVYGVQFSLQRQAEASGCLVSILVAKKKQSKGTRPYPGAAGWLARIWQGAGCKTIAITDWESAVNRAMQEPDRAA